MTALRSLSSMALLAAIVLAGSSARAQPAMPGYGAAPVVPEYAHQVTTPNVPLLVGGGLGFTAAYVTSAAMAASHVADPRLLVPVAGPWLALGRTCIDRGQCASSSVSRGLVAGSGIVQAAGLAVFVAGVLSPHRRWVLSGEIPHVATVEVLPAALVGGAGVAAVGRF